MMNQGILQSPAPPSMPPSMAGIVRPVQVPPQGMMFMHGLPGQMRPLLGMPQPGFPPFGVGPGGMPRPPLLNPMGGHGPPPPMPLMNPGPPPGGMMSMPMPPMEPEDEPLSKKAKSAEDALIPEGQFLASNASPTTFNVAVPDKPELNLNGQLIPFTMALTESISILKAKINEATGLAPGKQKLSKDGLFFKDQNSLAFYNVGDSVIVQLSLKERGGRKK